MQEQEADVAHQQDQRAEIPSIRERRTVCQNGTIVAPDPTARGHLVIVKDVEQADMLAWVAERRWAIDMESRALKLAEEAGEVVGAVVKIPEGRKQRSDLAIELAQLVLCAKALAEASGIDLDAAVSSEWEAMNDHL